MPTHLTIDQVRRLLKVMENHGQVAVVDWGNRRIDVLSEERTRPTVIMSDGQPMKYRDRLHTIRG
jgi:hypothetical protein